MEKPSVTILYDASEDEEQPEGADAPVYKDVAAVLRKRGYPVETLAGDARGQIESLAGEIGQRVEPLKGQVEDRLGDLPAQVTKAVEPVRTRVQQLVGSAA